MQNPIETIEQEHEDVERELLELETVMEEDEVNYSNFTHVFNRLCVIWDKHEEKEEKIFPILKSEKIIIPVKKMLFEHKKLRKHKDAINKAIASGNNSEMKKILEKDGKIIIEKLRKHINDEDEVLYTIALEEFTSEQLEKLWDSVK